MLQDQDPGERSQDQWSSGCFMGKRTVWFFNMSDANRTVQPQQTARSLEFLIMEEEGLYYPLAKTNTPIPLGGVSTTFPNMGIKYRET